MGQELIRPGWWLWWVLLIASPVVADQNAPDVRDHADQNFERLHEREQGLAPANLDTSRRQNLSAYNPEHFLLGQGQGDLSKGKWVCQRVSELAARADIAKQIRVLVKEHATDRLRERTGREVEQDIEVVREEIVQEYLQGVNIIERHTDEAAKTCSALAAMPKHRLQVNPLPEPAASDSPVRR